jgi:hypothetical protein
LGGIAFRPPLRGHFHAVGPGYDIDTAAWNESRLEWVPAAVIEKNWHDSPNWWHWGTVQPDWALHPSPLPEQMAEFRRVARVRALLHGDCQEAHVWGEQTGDPAEIARWTALLAEDRPLVVPGHSRLHVLLDLGDYCCGYPVFEVSGGSGSRVTLQWAEALFLPEPTAAVLVNKGQRDVVDGRCFFGFGDCWRLDGSSGRWSAFWWRAGRYQLLSVETAEEPLTLTRLGIEETRYPLTLSGRFDCEDPAVMALQPILARSILCSVHETLADSPYYEQMMYVGDTRLELLCTYVMSADRRPARRAIELFDWSRWRTGLVAQRYPSDPFQLSATFSMLWVGMVRDFAWWDDDAEFVRQRLVGVRGVTEQLLALRNENGLVARLPGWSFVDWVDGWFNGVPPGECEAGSASVNLQLLGLLLDAADLEQAFGDPQLAARCRKLAAELSATIRRVFWDSARQMFAETAAHTIFTSHAQVLAIVGGLVESDDARRLLEQVRQTPGLARCSLYFTHYLFEAAQRCGDAGVFPGQLPRWHALRAAGFVTTPESEAHPRSDCHGWAAHPLFHFAATVAGVRPAAPGFARVAINPTPGSLGRIDADVPHPRGQVVLRLTIAHGELTGGIELPPHTEGVLGWAGRRFPLRAGGNVVATGCGQSATAVEGERPQR